MIPAWLAIAVVAILIVVGFNRLSAQDIRWFRQLRRPQWLTFEWAIPIIWISIFICGGWSAYYTWSASGNAWLMAFYALVEIVIMAYTPVMCKLQSLKVGTFIGGLGFVLGAILAGLVWPISPPAFWLLLPYLLWSPVGTYVTWVMSKLNPADA